MSDEREDKREGDTPDAPAAADQPEGTTESVAPPPATPPPPPEVAAPVAGGLGVAGVLAIVLVTLSLLGAAAFATFPMWRPVAARLLATPGGPDPRPEIAALGAGLRAAEARIETLSARLEAIEAQPAPIAAAPVPPPPAPPPATPEPPTAAAPMPEPAPPSPQPPARGADQPDFGPRIDALAARLQALSQQLQTVQAPSPPPPADPAALRGLAEQDRAFGQQIETLRHQLDALKGDVETVGAKAAAIGRLGDRIEAVEAGVAALARLAERVEALDGAVRRVAERRGSAEALLLAVAQLREAASRGEPYRAEWEAVASLTQGQPGEGLDALAAGAATGLPTHAALARAFEALAPQILRAEIMPQGDGLMRQTLDRLSQLVSVRRTDGGGAESTSGRVAAAQKHLAEGDLAGAVGAVAGLNGPAAERAASWLAEAGARLSADKALSELTARAAAQAGAKTGG